MAGTLFRRASLLSRLPADRRRFAVEVPFFLGEILAFVCFFLTTPDCSIICDLPYGKQKKSSATNTLSQQSFSLLSLRLLRNRIVSTSIPGMATTYPLEPEQKTTKNTSFLYRLKHILATTRVKTTDASTGEKTQHATLTRHETLVKPYQMNQQLFQHTETLYDISLPPSKRF